LLRCPSCGGFTLVRGPLRVHEQCHDCGLFFIHDEGTWLGVWHINYPISAILAIVPATVFVARGSWSVMTAVLFAVLVSLLFPVLFYWHSYSLWTATYYYFVPDDLRMGRDRPPKLSSEQEALLSDEDLERLWAEEAVLDLEGDRQSRVDVAREHESSEPIGPLRR
jgi:hypothetical protein